MMCGSMCLTKKMGLQESFPDPTSLMRCHVFLEPQEHLIFLTVLYILWGTKDSHSLSIIRIAMS